MCGANATLVWNTLDTSVEETRCKGVTNPTFLAAIQEIYFYLYRAKPEGADKFIQTSPYPSSQNRRNMRIVIQRTAHASVTIEGHCKASIGKGMLILVGIEEGDGEEDIQWLCKKVVNLRIFDDENGVMNRSILDDGGDILVISQFTLHASTKKGNRPSYIRAARPEISIPLYEAFCKELTGALGKPIGTGEFGADMKVELLNDGPVTILIDSKNKE